jgi:hypothetical protein
LLHPPLAFLRLLGKLPPGVRVRTSLPRAKNRQRPATGYIHLFATRAAPVAASIQRVKSALALDGMLWISWPKRTSGIAGDLSEDVVRGLGLASGLVDVKVCAIDANWSALKFVYRLRDRVRQT